MKFGIDKSSILANRQNIRKGLRFSSPLFKAVEDEFVRRLEHESGYVNEVKENN